MANVPGNDPNAPQQKLTRREARERARQIRSQTTKEQRKALTKTLVNEQRVKRGKSITKIGVVLGTAAVTAGASTGAAAGAEGAAASQSSTAATFGKSVGKSVGKNPGLVNDARNFVGGNKPSKRELKAQGLNWRQRRQVRSAASGGIVKGLLTADIGRGIHNIRAVKAYGSSIVNKTPSSEQQMAEMMQPGQGSPSVVGDGPAQKTPTRTVNAKEQWIPKTIEVMGSTVRAISGVDANGKPFTVVKNGKEPATTMTGKTAQGVALAQSVVKMVQQQSQTKDGVTKPPTGRALN